VAFEPDAAYTLVSGANASGKTSLLEAIAYLGRGKSFRGGQTGNLVRHGETQFVLFGEIDTGSRIASLGVRNSREGLEVRVDGESASGAAELAAVLPLQLIDPDVHNLVSGGPDERRRYLDWIAFHVEHDYLDHWRNYRRALKQRNAALKAGGRGLSAWDTEILELGKRLDAVRRRVLETSLPALLEQGDTLLGSRVGFEYAPGWAAEKTFADALQSSLDRDLAQGTTHVGPHRADLRLLYDERQARKLVSRGQQKLLASAMILAASQVVQASIGRPLVLLLDDPAAELDGRSLARLLERVVSLGGQVIATSLDPDALSFPQEPARFHVEHGELHAL
jgi:DNA replication and repair protein RecF